MRRFGYRNRKFGGEERVLIRKHEEQTLQEWYVFLLNSWSVLFCASTQGMKLSRGVAIKLKRMGYKKGFPDVIIDEPRGGWHGMRVELKMHSYPSAEQKEWRSELLRRGYYSIIVPGNFDFREAREYLEKETSRYLLGQIKRPTPEQTCPHCFLDKAIRNPSGYCDHLYYPDSCEVCQTIRRKE